MNIETAELCDHYGDAIQILNPIFKDYGGRSQFYGQVSNVRVFEDFAMVRDILQEPGEGRVLVVDGNAYQRGALLGGKMAVRAAANGWAGVVINGCVRDVDEISHTPIGIRALNSIPARSGMQGTGERNVELHFAGVRFTTGCYLYADLDGMVISDTLLEQPG